MEPIKRPLNPRFVRPVDGMMRVPRRTVTAVRPPAPIATRVVAPPPQSLALPKKPKPRLKDALQMVVVIVLGIAAGLIFQFLPLGQVGVIIYGVIAIARRVPSYITFMALLAAFVCLAVLTAVGKDGLIAQNIAIYAFFLFIIGVVCAALEIRRASKQSGSQPAKEVVPI